MRTFLYVMSFFVTALGIAFSVLWSRGALPAVVAGNLPLVGGVALIFYAGLVLLGLAAAGGSARGDSGAGGGESRDRKTSRSRKTAAVPAAPVLEETPAPRSGQSAAETSDDEDDIFLVNPLDE